MKIEATYDKSYNKGRVEVVSGHTQICEDWLSEGEVYDLAIQFKDAYLEFSKNKLSHLIEEALDDARYIEGIDSDEGEFVISRLQEAVRMLEE